MDQSILTDIKKLLGITEEYEIFDQDLIIHINSALNIVRQLGVGPNAYFRIEDSSTVWEDLFNDSQIVDMVRSYIFLKVKMQFDPPTNSIAAEAYKAQIAEYEWRMNVDVETPSLEVNA